MEACTVSSTISLARTEDVLRVQASSSNILSELPAEIEREIFEITARNFPGTSVKLAGLSKKTQYWMDWHIYETVVLDHPTTRAAFLRTLDARPAEFFSQRIKKLYLSYTVTMPEAQKILSVCTGLTQLTCWAHNSLQTQGWLLPYLNPHSNSHLTRLSIKLDMLTSKNTLPSFSDAIYQRLTHLDIVLPPPVNLGAFIDWRALLDLPYLKHLIIGDLNAWGHFYLLPVLRDLLSSSVRLETLAILTKEPRMLEALEVENFDDPRLVILPRFNWPENLPTYWKKLYTGELDAWEPSAEQARKQQLEWNEKRCDSSSASASKLTRSEVA